jgi:hypothetical protein
MCDVLSSIGAAEKICPVARGCSYLLHDNGHAHHGGWTQFHHDSDTVVVWLRTRALAQ